MTEPEILEVVRSMYKEFEKRFLESQEAQNNALASVKREIESKTEIALHAQEHAITVANTELSRRLDGMNEFRGTLKDQNATFVTRDSFETQNLRHQEEYRVLDAKLSTGLSVDVYRVQHEQLSNRVDELSRWKAERESTLVQIGNISDRLSGLETWRAGRESIPQQLTDVAGKVEKLDGWVAKQEGKASRSNMIAIGAVFISGLVLLLQLTHIIK
jgi:hypothetical protein